MSVSIDDAFAAVGRIAAVTTGWSDTAVERYAHEIASQCSDVEALAEAARDLAVSWTEMARPTLGNVLDAYRTVCRRNAMSAEQPAIATGTGVIDPRRGRLIAANEYAGHCRRSGREPNVAYFDQIVAAIPTKTPRRSR
jgi:hypothetical protein